MNQHLQREFLGLGRNRQQIIRDGSFAARKEYIQNQLANRQFADRNALIQGQLAKLNALLIHEKIPDFYAYYFMGQLSLCYDQTLEQALYRELQMIRNRRSHYHTIIKTLQTRQTCLRSLSTSIQSLFQTSEEGLLYKLQEQISHYRQLTALLIEQIRQWLQYLRSINGAIYGDEHIAFFYHNEDYLLKILDDTGFICKSFLSTRVMFSHKQDPFIMRPFTQNQSGDPYVLMFKFESHEKERYIKCLQFVAEERADYLRRKITIRQDRIKEIKRVYQNKNLNQKIFMVGRQDANKPPKPEMAQAQIDFVEEPAKSPVKQAKPLIKAGLLRQFNLQKEREVQVKGEMIRKIKDMQFSSSNINFKRLGRDMHNYEERPVKPQGRFFSPNRRPFKPVVKPEKEQFNSDFEEILRRKELQVLDFDNKKRRTLSTMKLQDKLSLRGPFDNKEGAQELQKIMDQLQQTYPQRQQVAVLSKESGKERGKTLLQNNEETIGNLRKTILKQMQEDQVSKLRFEEEKQKERDKLQLIIKQKLDNMNVLKLQKEKEKRVQEKQVLAYEMGKRELFGLGEPSPDKSSRLTELQDNLKREMRMKWLREVQQQLSHREGMDKYQKQMMASDVARQKQLQVALRKQQQEERFGEIEKEERAKAMQGVWQEQDRRKREIEEGLTVIVQKEKQRLEEFSGQQKIKLQQQMKELMKSKLLVTLRRESSLYRTQQSNVQRLRQEEERHRQQTRLKMQQQFKLSKQSQRQREKEEKTKKLKLIAEQMDKLEKKVQPVEVDQNNSRLQQMKRSLSDIPDFRKEYVSAKREPSKKRMREQFELQLFAFNRPAEFSIQQDNFLIKDFKSQLDNEQNLNSKQVPIQVPQPTDPKQKQDQVTNRQKPTTQNAQKEEVSSQFTDKFTRFSEIQKQQVKISDMEVELKKMKVPMSSEEYRIYLKKKSVIDSKRIEPVTKPKEKAAVVDNKPVDNFQMMQIDQHPDSLQDLDRFHQQQQAVQMQLSQISYDKVARPQNSSPKRAVRNQDSSEVLKKTQNSRGSPINKKRFATSDSQDQFLKSSIEQQKIKRPKKVKKQRRKQQTLSKSPQKKQKSVARQNKEPYRPLQVQKASFKVVNEQDLDAYLMNHFKMLPKVIRKLNLLKKDELLKTILQCKSVMIIECSKGETVIGVAFVCENQNKQSIRSLNIIHLGAYNEADMLMVLIKARELLFLRDPCVQITFSMYYDKQNEEQDNFIKMFQQQFDPYGAIFQKKISNDTIQRKHVLRRIIGEESIAAIKHKQGGLLKVEQNLFAHSVHQSLGVQTNLSKVDRSFGGWTFLSLFLGKFAEEAVFTEQLNSDVSESVKSIKYISKMSLKLKESGSGMVQYRTFQSPFETNLTLVQQGQPLIKCDPSLQQSDIPIYWSRYNISMQPVLPFVAAKESFPYASHVQTASYLRYTCTKASKVINLKSSLYSSVITVIPCKPSNYKILILNSVEFDSQPQISLDLYLKLFLANLSQHNLNTDEHIWIPQIKSKGLNRIEEGQKFGFSNEVRAKLQLMYTQYTDNCVNYSRTHRDMFVTPPFIVAVLDSHIERVMQGSPIFAHRIDLEQMAGVITGQSLMEQSDM